jgi:hypothetical protein
MLTFDENNFFKASTEIVRWCGKLYRIIGAISQCNEVGFLEISIENYAGSNKKQQIVNVKNDTYSLSWTL